MLIISNFAVANSRGVFYSVYVHVYTDNNQGQLTLAGNDNFLRIKAHLQLVVRVLRSCALCVHFESTCKILVVDPTWNIQ